LVRRIKELLVQLVIKAKAAVVSNITTSPVPIKVEKPMTEKASIVDDNNKNNQVLMDIVTEEDNNNHNNDDDDGGDEEKANKETNVKATTGSNELKQNAFSRVFILRGKVHQSLSSILISHFSLYS